MLRKSPPRGRKEEKISTLSSGFVCGGGVVSLVLTVAAFFLCVLLFECVVSNIESFPIL